MLHGHHNCRSGVFKKCLKGVSRGGGGGLKDYLRFVKLRKGCSSQIRDICHP